MIHFEELLEDIELCLSWEKEAAQLYGKVRILKQDKK